MPSRTPPPYSWARLMISSPPPMRLPAGSLPRAPGRLTTGLIHSQALAPTPCRISCVILRPWWSNSTPSDLQFPLDQLPPAVPPPLHRPLGTKMRPRWPPFLADLGRTAMPILLPPNLLDPPMDQPNAKHPPPSPSSPLNRWPLLHLKSTMHFSIRFCICPYLLQLRQQNGSLQ